jgi:hypothetical protein
LVLFLFRLALFPTRLVQTPEQQATQAEYMQAVALVLILLVPGGCEVLYEFFFDFKQGNLFFFIPF